MHTACTQPKRGTNEARKCFTVSPNVSDVIGVVAVVAVVAVVFGVIGVVIVFFGGAAVVSDMGC